MFFWWFMFVCNLIYSFLLIVCGWCMWKHCPQEINSFVGYRTRRSKMNQDTWRFAHENCGRRWWRLGWLLLFPTVIVQIPFYGSGDAAVGRLGLLICIIECGLIVLSILPTEKALQRNFNEDGTRK